MSTAISYSGTTIDLDPDLYWEDESSWHPVEQSVQRTVTGALIVSAATRTKGRPITLRPLDDTSAWMARTTLDTLRAWAAVPGREMTLTLRGTSYQVIFRHQDGAAIEAEPIVHYSDVFSTDYYKITLRFMEI
ncbi:MAG: hypothetical protein ACK5OQ_16340 [Burkholderiales bacterium]|jgi:hypothetical protein